MNPSHEEIEMRAYDAWEERGRPLGSPETDWFKAEQELTANENEGILLKVAHKVGSAIGSREGSSRRIRSDSARRILKVKGELISGRHGVRIRAHHQ
jgi:hypothetical protein